MKCSIPRASIIVLVSAVLPLRVCQPDSAPTSPTDPIQPSLVGVHCIGQQATIDPDYHGVGSVVSIAGGYTITGTGGDDVIVGSGGLDSISGLGGTDRICAGTGDDVLIGGAGGDFLDGQGGTDLVDYTASPAG